MPVPVPIGDYVDSALGIPTNWPGKSPRYRHAATLKRLARRPNECGDLSGLVRRMLIWLEESWILSAREHRVGNDENWVLKVRRQANSQRSEEVLNRLIPKALGPAWYNEISVSSGVLGSGAMHIDLVHQLKVAEHYELIELKWFDSSGNALSAAVQVALYGAWLLFSRVHSQRMGLSKSQRPFLFADTVDLRILAPLHYYERVSQSEWFAGFEKQLNRAVSEVGQETVGGDFKMSFGYLQLSEGLAVPNASPKEIKAAIDDRSLVFGR